MDAMSFWFRSPIIESKRENKLFFIKLATIFGLEFSLWVRFLLFVSRYLAFIVNHNYTTIWGILFDFSNHLKQIYISFFIRFVLSLKIYFPNLSCFFGSQICGTFTNLAFCFWISWRCWGLHWRAATGRLFAGPLWRFRVFFLCWKLTLLLSPC